jgi:hypothetical protein
MTGEDYIGLAVTSHDQGVLSTATFENLESDALGFANVGPAVNAGPDLSVEAGSSASLSGSVSDDGNPDPPASVTTEWIQLSGPDSLVFADPQALASSTSPPSGGTYVLRLTADDGEVTTFDDLTLTANPVQSPIAAWQSQHFSDSSAPGAALDADPDGDGLSNLMEFALAADPMAASPGPSAEEVILDANPYLSLTYRRRSGGSGDSASGYTADGILYRVLAGHDLQSWGPTGIVEISVNDQGDGSEIVTVRLDQPVPQETLQFLRLQVTIP